MAAVAKVVRVIGSSPESWAKAADAAVQEASKTMRGISGAHVVSMSAQVEDGRISQYRDDGRHRVRRRELALEERLRELSGIEGPQVLDPFADAHELDRQSELVGDRERDSALGRAVELRQRDAADLRPPRRRAAPGGRRSGRWWRRRRGASRAARPRDGPRSRGGSSPAPPSGSSACAGAPRCRR